MTHSGVCNMYGQKNKHKDTVFVCRNLSECTRTPSAPSVVTHADICMSWFCLSLCFANQMIHSCLSRRTPRRTCVNFAGRRKCSMWARVDRSLGVLQEERRVDNQSCHIFSGLTEGPVGHHVVRMAVFTMECCLANRSHLYLNCHPSSQQSATTGTDVCTIKTI